MSAPIKLGVVGLGGRGFWLSHCAGRCDEVTVAAMADIDEALLDIAREKLPGVALYASGEEMAREADIAIATRKSLDAGQFVDLPLLDEIGE